MNVVWLERSAVPLGVYFLARMLGKYRGGKRQKEALTTPLVDAALLEAVFQPRPKDGDDPDLLAELRDTLTHLNRQTYAEEFWDLHTQLTALDRKLGATQKATLRRVLLRLVTANDRWLQAVGAKTAADLGLTEAVPPLRALLEIGAAGDARFRLVLEESLEALAGSQPSKTMPRETMP